VTGQGQHLNHVAMANAKCCKHGINDAILGLIASIVTCHGQLWELAWGHLEGQ
jgi:hypothetical protein